MTSPSEIKQTLKLAFPLIIAFVGYQTISLVDTFVSGRLGVNMLAAVSLGSAIYWVVTIFPLGVLIGLDPLISQAIGAKKPEQAWRYCRRGIALALIFSVFTMLIMWFVSLPGWPWSLAESQVTSLLGYYLMGRIWSVPLLLLHTCLRCFLQAHERTAPILIGTGISNLINLPLSLYLGGGDQLLNTLGLPSVGILYDGWGVFGIGVASVISSLIEVLFLSRCASQIGGQWLTPSSEGWGELCRVGLPIGGSLLSEGGVFSASTLIVSAWTPVVIGAHQVTLQLASYTFTICLGISTATAVRVGHAVGAHRWDRARGAAGVGLLLSLLVMSMSALTLALFGGQIASLISPDPQVIQLASELLLIAAAFQLFDGVQVTAAGALRGASFTKIPMWSALISHWGVGLPLALFLAFQLNWGVKGLWWGLCGGLFSASIILLISFHRLTSQAQKAQRRPS